MTMTWRAAAGPGLTAAVAAATFWVAGSTASALFLAVAIGLLASVAGQWRPRAATASAVVLVSVVPIYYGRYVPGTNIGLTPVVLVSLALVPAALRYRGSLRVKPIDGAVLGYVGLRVISYLLNYQAGAAASVGLLLVVLLPYAVFRLLLLQADAHATVGRAFVLSGAALSGLAIPEHRGWPNPFFDLVPLGYRAELWARPELRLDSVRSETSFGHPIAFGMFLAFAIVLAIAFGYASRGHLERTAYLAAIALMTIALVDTLSRGPMLVFALSALVWLASQLRRATVVRFGVLAISALVVGAVIVSADDTIGALRARSTGDTREARSAEVRLEVLRIARDPDNFSILGRDTPESGGVNALVTARTGLRAIDNAFALIYLGGGLLVLLAFVLIAVATWATALSRRMTPIERAWVVGLAVAFLNLVTVNLLTQHADLFWIGIAGVACLSQRRVPVVAVGRPGVALHGLVTHVKMRA